MKNIPKAEQSTFADKAASLGLPVALAAKARNEELYKLPLFAVTQLEWLDRGDPDHVQFSAACVAFFGFLQHFPPDDFYDTVAYRTFLRVAVGFVFFIGVPIRFINNHVENGIGDLTEHV